MDAVDIVVVGNEVLLGMVLDTNSSYLCRVVRGMGGRVKHVSVVGDDAAAIASEIESSLSRAALVFTCGGLGPTHDDLTLSAIAEATQRRLVSNSDARHFVATRYRELADAGSVKSADMTDSRLKMALLPEGAEPVENPVGAAPAVTLRCGPTLIVALPGVPKELKSIVEGPLQELLNRTLGGGAYRECELTANFGDESVLAPILRTISAAHPDAYIKSRAQGFGPDVKFRITISASGKNAEQASQSLDAARADVEAALASAGIASAVE